MRHCCQFKPDDVYYLCDTNLFSSRKLSIGYCPICLKPVAELQEKRFDGEWHKVSLAGIKANDLMLSLRNDIQYSMRECNYQNAKSKPFGWRYGINRVAKLKSKEVIEQYACDFYGNTELIKRR